MKSIEEIAEACRDYYCLPGNESGGNLHIVLDDGNVETRFVVWCLKECWSRGDKQGEQLCGLLLELTEEERQTVLEMASHRRDIEQKEVPND